MDTLVIDSSVLVKWFVTEPYSDASRAIRAEYRGGRLLLLAPDLLYAEIGNIVWKKHLYQGLEAEDAQSIIDTVSTLPIEITPAADLLGAAYTLAVSYRRSVYDCLYLALAVRRGCAFVTADERLVNAVAGAIPGVVWLPDWQPAPQTREDGPT